jgi:hypothetical protein
MGFEPTTFCMASRRSSQLSYSRARSDSSFTAPFPDRAPDRPARSNHYEPVSPPHPPLT